jgi:hypothetical protein
LRSISRVALLHKSQRSYNLIGTSNLKLQITGKEITQRNKNSRTKEHRAEWKKDDQEPKSWIKWKDGGTKKNKNKNGVQV